VTNKKISDFRGDCFLKLLNGEQDKLIEVRFSSEFIIRIRALFQSWLPFYLEVCWNVLQLIKFENPAME